MSTSASTVPGKRESFIVKRPQIDTRLIRRPRKILRGLPEVEEVVESEQGEVLVEREDFHKAFGRGRGFSYAFVGDEEAKVWTKSKPLTGEIAEVNKELEAEKLKKERKFGPNTLAKAFSRPSRPVNDKLLDLKNRKTNREDFRKFMNMGPKKPKNQKKDNVNASNDAAKALMLTGFEDVNKLAEERRQLLEFDRVARKRIKQLEGEVSQLEQSFESLTRENQQLRSKMNSEDQVVIETYQRVFEDRQILRKSEASYKSIISNLESQLKEQQKANAAMEKELKDLKAKYPSITDRLETQAKAAQSYWDSKSYKDENGRLRKLNEQLTNENKELQKQISKTNATQGKSPRPVKAPPRSQRDIPIDYNPYEDEPTPKKVTFTKSKSRDSGILKKYDDDYLYGVREDFLNMLPDYYPDKRGFYKVRY